MRGCGDECSEKVQCPIWQCSGHLKLVFRDVKVDNDSAWQLPDIVCDDCKTVFSNSLREKMVDEFKEQKLKEEGYPGFNKYPRGWEPAPAMIVTPFSESDFKLGLNKPKSKSNPNGFVKK